MDEQQWRNQDTLDAPDAPAAAVTTVPVAASKPKKHIPWLWVWIGIGFMILITAVLVILWLRQTVNKTQANNQANKIKVQTIDLNAISGNSSSITLNSADKVVINGQLQSNDGVILTPTAQPSAATLGQIYVDKTSNTVRYYNGQSFVTLAIDNGKICNKNDVDCGFATQAQVAALVSASSTNTTAVESLQGASGALSLVGTGGLTVSSSGTNINLSLPQNLTVTSNPIFAGMTISGLTGNSIVATDTSSTLQAVTPAAPGLCLISTAGLPTFSSCVSGGASVASLDGLTGALILANSSGSGSTVTIDNASTGAKGIAQFNATNFSVSSGTVNTIQDIATTSTPTFAGVLTNSIDRASAGTLTLGATTATAISLNQDTTVANSKNLTVSGGNISQTGSGTLSTGTGNVLLNGNTTVASGKTFTALGTALFQASTASTFAFLVNNASSATVLGVDTSSITNLVTNSTFNDVDGTTGWTSLGAPTPTPTTFTLNSDNSYDLSSNSLMVVNNGGAVQGAGYAVSLDPGIKYTLTVRVKALTARNQKVYIGYYTGSDLSTKVECNASGLPIVDTQWKTLSCTFTTGVSGAAGIYVRSNKNSGDWLLDKVVLQTGNYAAISNGYVNLNASTNIVTDSDSAFRVQSTSALYPIMNLDSNLGQAIFRPVTNDTDTLQVRNADDSVVFNVKAGSAGNLGPWGQTSTSHDLPASRNDFQAAKATVGSGATYGYVIGGHNSIPSVYYAQLTGNGDEVWLGGNTNGLPAVSSEAVVVAKGYIYVIGGDTGSTATTNVYYAKINPDGDVSDWQLATNQLTTARTGISGVYYNGYMYVVAGKGSNGTGTPISPATVTRAQVFSDGSIGPWTTSSFPAPLGNYSIGVTEAGKIIVVGGLTTANTVVNTVYYATVTGPSGALNSWQTDSDSLPSPDTQLTMQITSQYVYVFGGKNGSTSYSDYWYAPLDSTDAVDVWSGGSQSGAFVTDPNGAKLYIRSSGSIIFNDTIYSLGGIVNGSSSSKIYYSHASGTSSAVTVNGSLNVTNNTSIQGSLSIVTTVNNSTALRVANSAGEELLNLDTVSNNITLGGSNTPQIHNWQTTTELNTALSEHGSTTLNGYLYVTSGSSIPKVSYAKIKTDGSVSNWVDNSVDLPNYKNKNATISANGYIYVVGGIDSGGTSNKIYYGKPSSTGEVSSWSTSSNNLSKAVSNSAIAVANGYLYILGGRDSTSTPVADVQYAHINANGSLGAFSTTTALSAGLTGGRSVVANGYLYFTGGSDGTTAQSGVYYAPLNTDGTIGAWTNNSIAEPANPRTYHSAIIANGYLYLIGGTDNTGTTLDTIDYGKLEGNGSISNWATTTDRIPDPVTGHTTIVANGYVYVIGGNSGSKLVFYASTARISIGGSLDLVGLGSRTLSDSGGGGQLTAGNTTIVGTLDVRDAANFTQSLSVNGTFTAHDDVLLQSESNSANAFQVQNSSGTVLLGVDASAGQVNVNADMLFGDTNTLSVNTLQHTGNGHDLNVDAGSDVLTFTTGGKTFIFPTSGPSSQTICTTGISCASGGGQAVLLAQGTVQTNNTADPSIFLNSTSTGGQLQLQSSGTDVFVVSKTGVLTLGTPNSIGGSIIFSDGTSSYSVTLNTKTLGGNQTVRFPDASGDICLSIGNCAGAGAGVTASTPGTANTIAKFTSGGNIGDSNLTDDGTTVAIQGSNGLVVGTNAITGQVALKNGSFSAVLQPGGLTGNTTYTLPTGSGSAQTICTTSGNCVGGGLGSNLQDAYDAGNSITTSDNRNINFNLADTTTDSSFVVNLQGTGNQIKFQDGGTDVFNISDGGVFTLKSTSNSSSAFVLQNNSNVALLTADASAMKLKIGNGTPILGSTPNGGLYVTDKAEFASDIRVGGASDYALFDSTNNNKLRFSGLARNTKTVQLTPEYTGAVLNGTGQGTMTADICSGSSRLSINTSVCASTETYNYYSWTTSQSTTQTYNIYAQVKMPSDFNGFISNSTISMYGWRTGSSDVVELTMYNAAGTACGSATTVSTSNITWTLTSLTGSETTDAACTAIQPDDLVTFKIRMTAATSEYARAGAIKFSYYSNF